MSAGDYADPPVPCSRCGADVFAPFHADARGDPVCDACWVPPRERAPRPPSASAERGTRPRLTARTVRGLRRLASLASAEIESGAATEYWPRREVDEAEAALAYVYALCGWAETRRAGAPPAGQSLARTAEASSASSA